MSERQRIKGELLGSGDNDVSPAWVGDPIPNGVWVTVREVLPGDDDLSPDSSNAVKLDAYRKEYDELADRYRQREKQHAALVEAAKDYLKWADSFGPDEDMMPSWIERRERIRAALEKEQ